MATSALPPELWRSIFKEAVHVPLLLDTEWDYEPDDRLWEGWGAREITPDEQASTKCAITLVCREWKVMCTELLYEFIHIPSLEDYSGLSLLVESFKTSGDDSDSKLGYGWWTKRIDCPSDILDSPMVVHLFNLLEVCHNVQIFTVNGSSITSESIQTQLAQMLHSRFSHSLRRLEMLFRLRNQGLPIDNTSVLPDIPLRCLGMTVHESVLDRPLHPSFDNVTTLMLFFPFTFTVPPAHLFFSRLRALSLLGIGRGDIQASCALIERHKNTLIYLHIQTSVAVMPTLPELLFTSPNIQTCTLDQIDLNNVARFVEDGTAPIMGLSHFGILGFGEEHMSEIFWMDVQTLLGSGALPDLRVIRLLALNAQVSSNTTEWTNGIKVCQRHNVRLEDMYGHLVVVLPSSQPE